MIEELKKNIEQEKNIIRDLNSIHKYMNESPEDKNFYMGAIKSLLKQLKIINGSIPSLLKGIKISQEQNEEQKKQDEAPKTRPERNEPKEKETQKTKPAPQPTNVSSFSYVSPSTNEKRYVSINKEDKKKFLEQLRVSESVLSKRKNQKTKKEKGSLTKKRKIPKISNKLFKSLSDKIAPSMGSLADDLKKSNMNFLIRTYISVALFTSTLILIAGFFAILVASIIDFSYIFYIWAPFLLFTVSLIGFYIYPSSEKSNVQKNITKELPFATIHMSAIAGSEIEPTQIFKIVSSSDEYPNIGKEMKKIIVQVEIYGYDLVSSLKDVAQKTSNEKFSELLNGMAINISTGGSMKNYLEKKSENFLSDHRMESEKYSALAGTFMDVYIALLIAAPLILMLLFIIMGVVGLGVGGLNVQVLIFISVGIVVLLNVMFLIALQVKQPEI